MSASDSSHGDLGSIQKKDVLILISYSGQTNELKNIIQYANRNKILLIGIMSKKESILYKASDIKLLIPQVKESGGVVPRQALLCSLLLVMPWLLQPCNIRNLTNLILKNSSGR